LRIWIDPNISFSNIAALLLFPQDIVLIITGPGSISVDKIYIKEYQQGKSARNTKYDQNHSFSLFVSPSLGMHSPLVLQFELREHDNWLIGWFTIVDDWVVG
jgi:hypothetical protein